MSLLHSPVHVPGITTELIREWASEAIDAAYKADANVAAMDNATRATVGWAMLRADAEGASVAEVDAYLKAAVANGVGARRRADSAYYEGDLTAPLRDEPFERPQRDRMLLTSIPIESVPAGQEYYTARFEDLKGRAAIYTPGDEAPPRADVERTEQPRRKMHAAWNCISQDWLGSLRDGFAGRDNSGARRRAAILAHEQLWNDALQNGVAGLDYWGLKAATGLPALRETGAVTYGSATADQAFADFEQTLQRIPEVSEGTNDAPDTIMFTRRIWNRLISYQNYVAGGNSNAIAILRAKLSQYGISQVVVADELRNYGGSNVDALVLSNRASDDQRLRHVMGLTPAPIRTVQTTSGDVTVFASISGGLYAPIAGSTYIKTIPVSV